MDAKPFFSRKRKEPGKITFLKTSKVHEQDRNHPASFQRGF